MNRIDWCIFTGWFLVHFIGISWYHIKHYTTPSACSICHGKNHCAYNSFLKQWTCLISSGLNWRIAKDLERMDVWCWWWHLYCCCHCWFKITHQTISKKTGSNGKCPVLQRVPKKMSPKLMTAPMLPVSTGSSRRIWHGKIGEKLGKFQNGGK